MLSPTPLGRDFLGILSVGNRIMNDLLPALTSNTVHPRYYSFLCWVFQKSIEWGECKDGVAQKRFLYKAESILLYASAPDMHPHRYPLPRARIGGQKMDKILEKGRSTLPLLRKDVGRTPTAYDVQYYRPSMKELRLLQWNEGIILPSEQRGALLVKTYERSVKPCLTLLKTMLQSDSVKRAQVKEVAKYICPCMLHNDSDESEALRQLLFADVPQPKEADLQRRESLLFLLQGIKLNPAAANARWDLPATAYYLRHASGAYSINDKLRETVNGWAAYQWRSNFQYAISAMWWAFLEELNSKPAIEQTVEEIAAAWTSDLVKSSFFQSAVPKLKGKKIVKMQEIISAMVRDGVANSTGPLEPLEEIVRRATQLGLGSGPLREDHLRNKLSEEERPYAAAGYALLLLLSTSMRWSPANIEEWRFANTFDDGGLAHLSNETLLKDAADVATFSLQDFLAWAVRRYVIDQHFITAYDKLLGNRNTFHFRKGDRGFFITDDRTGQWESANYIDAALRLLHALGLATWDVQNKTFRISGAGLSYLKSTGLN